MIAELETQPESEMTTETGKKQKKSKQTQLVFAAP